MALARMSKVQLALHNTIAAEIAQKLQTLGCCEFINKSNCGLSDGAIVEIRSKQCHIDELLADVRFVTRLLEPLEVNKESSFARMLGDIPEISFSDLSAKVDEMKFKTFVEETREKERELTECRAEIARQKGLISQLNVLKSIKWPLELFTSGTDMISGVVYAVQDVSVDEFISTLSSKFGEFFEYQKFESVENDSTVTFAFLLRKSDADAFQAVASEFSATRIDVPKEFILIASEEEKTISNKINTLETKEETIFNGIVSVADEGLEMARYYGDYWTILRDRIEAMLKGDSTQEVLIWSFWVPDEALCFVKKTLLPYDSLTEFNVVEPDEGEEPPTLLENPAWSSCSESLTLMYGTPTYGTIDPTSLMAPFFFLFFGMCFGDAGYGLILSGVFGYFLVRHQLSPALRKFFILLTIGMLCSIFVGAVTGSWFGDSITAFPFLSALIPFKDAVQFLDPMNDPMTFLKISLGLGFIHVIFGLMIAFAGSWKKGDKTSAVLDQLTWIFFLISLVIFGISAGGSLPQAFILPSKIATIAGALILIATQGREKGNIFSKLLSGILSLYNVTGFLGDVLSYSRLLALGLGSAAVGMVINLLGTLVSGTPYIGIFLAALIFIIGHTFSIVVNILGAFVHSLRLQYVEFFGKFYDAAGSDFAPLCNSTQFAKLVDESNK
ncbi:MAG: V-type ATP synthase subunit I [Synergistaceae bacterium]